NLRPAGKRGFAPSLIAEAVRQSVEKFSRDTDALSHLWCDVKGSLKNLPKQFSEEECERLTRLVREKGFPPLHHSHSYRKFNRPAYRVVIRQELERLMRPFSDDAL
ncbi:MAG: hypothetical protein JSV16_03015, partial [Candidatus Hydrogenedentota bacterium]